MSTPSPSNRKPGAATPAPTEPIKRSVAACLRALARTPDIEVSYASERPALVGSGPGARARLPEPPRKITARDAAILRGLRFRRHAAVDDRVVAGCALPATTRSSTAAWRRNRRPRAPCSTLSSRPASNRSAPTA
jgi:cobalamin biosynthesis protein CobT